MNKLTSEEIELYVRPANETAGIEGITRERLEAIDLDAVNEVVVDRHTIMSPSGVVLYKFDNFTPVARTVYLKPSFAGRQILLGRVGRQLYFSNGNLFAV